MYYAVRRTKIYIRKHVSEGSACRDLARVGVVPNAVLDAPHDEARTGTRAPQYGKR